MADRCDECKVRLDGVTEHEYHCSSRNEDIRTEARLVAERLEATVEVLKRYRDRCPCGAGDPCSICESLQPLWWVSKGEKGK